MDYQEIKQISNEKIKTNNSRNYNLDLDTKENLVLNSCTFMPKDDDGNEERKKEQKENKKVMEEL